MKKLSFLIAVFIFLAANIFAQDLRKKAEENPLDCYFYLLTKQKPDDRDRWQIEKLIITYSEINLYEKAFDAINLFENTDYKVGYFTFISKTLIADGKRVEANKFLTEAVKNVNAEDAPARYTSTELVQTLIELGRTDEAINIAKILTDEFEENDVTMAVADEFLKRGQTEKLREFTAQSFFPHESENNLTRAKLALIYARLQQTEKSQKILKELEETAFFGESEIDANNNRERILFPLLRVHLELGETEKAFELWNQRGDQENFYEISKFIDNLIEYNQKEKALLLLAQMQLNKEQMNRNGENVVKGYLNLSDFESALSIAKNMSENDDNYSQQQSLMILTDKFIADGKHNAALEVLDFAFQRVKKIVFAHEPYQSIGASSGSRKIIYLRNIYNRLIKLKQFDKAFDTINAIKSDHWSAKEFVVESLTDFVGHRAKNLPRKKIDQILTRIKTIYTDEDDKDYKIHAEPAIAEIYALTGNKLKSVEHLTKILKDATEISYSERYLLFQAGKIFEQNKLKATADLKKVLKKYIEDAE